MRVCFAYYDSLSPFIRQDYDLLSRTHEVVLFNFRREFFKSLRTVANCDLTFCWFASLHSAYLTAIAKSLGRKSVLVAGGYDVASVPELGYGAFQYSLPTRIATRYALRNADRILVVAPSLKAEAIKNAGIDGSTVTYLPTGYDSGFWEPNQFERQRTTVLTVAHVNQQTIMLKGLDTVIGAASLMPDTKFVIAGALMDNAAQRLAHNSPPNISFAGLIPQTDLKELYQSAGIYCQLSRHDGFPNALCEAMLCGCVPIGTTAGGIPDAIGDTGELVAPGDTNGVAAAIRRALNASESHRDRARQCIATRFTLSRREQGLLSVIENLEEDEPEPRAGIRGLARVRHLWL
jgi:glycosyltransferase involved in cell wall biosynthesis